MIENLVWCASCGADASLARAVAELPCEACGDVNWFIAASADDRDAILDLAERMQRISCWEVAESALRRCRELEFITEADYRLTLSTLRFRHDCANAADELIAAGEIDANVLRDVLTEQFDPYTVHWLFTKYKGLAFEVRHGKET